MSTSFTSRTDRRLIQPTVRGERFVLAHIEAPRAATGRPRPPVNLAIVLDRSGSMSGPKLDVARRAVEEAIARLEPADRFSIVVYDDRIDVVESTTAATADARRRAVDRLREIDARGSTNLGGGWLRGCEQLAASLLEGGVNRCLLLTDGLANVGITDPDELTRHARELRARGISTTTFGVGHDFDEALLQSLADAGGGHFYYIADAAQIRDAITGEVGETLEIVARDAALVVAVREGVEVESLSPYAVSERAGNWRVALGDLGSGQELDVVLRLRFPHGQLGDEIVATLSLSDRDGVFAPGGAGDAAPVRLTWAYVDQAADERQERDADVDRAVARLTAAQTRQAAVAHNRRGDYSIASGAFLAQAQAIRSYAGSDAELNQLATELEVQAREFAEPMAAPALKAVHYSSANAMRSRDGSGRARKRA